MDQLLQLDDFGLRGQSAMGIVAFIAIAWLLSERKLQFPLVSVGLTIAVQISFAVLLLYFPPARAALQSLRGFVEALQAATSKGTELVFGYLGGGEAPFEVVNGAAMFTFAFGALPLVIFFSGLAALLWHWKILKLFVRGFAFLLQRVLRVGGAVALSSAANVFLGQTEAPLAIRPYLERISRSELFVVITVGFSTVAGTVMALYASILQETNPAALGHIITASFIAVPGGILLAQIMVPPDRGALPTSVDAADDFQYDSSMDAFTTGVADGLKLYLNIIAGLIAFTAMAALIDLMLAMAPDIAGEPLTLKRIFGFVFAPLLWLAGVPWSEAIDAGTLMAVKTTINELVAYIELAKLPPDAFSDRSELILIYAMCGFANFASLGIITGGLSVLAPIRRLDVIALAPKALITGTLATLMSGAVIGLVWSG